jgi:C4-dicarboxylate-specific signal transduction histidine kinase
MEAVAVLILGVAIVLLMRWLGYGLQLSPLVVAAGWIGFRGGRVIAWVAVLLISLISLPLTMAAPSDVERVIDHMLLLSIIAAGYLAGSYADAQTLAAAEISRRDKLLYQAGRLKTLRAMSVAVIHELSQPLSTISLEANGLLSTTSRVDCDLGQVRQMAEIIARKSSDLSQLIARLRQFGERGSDVMVRVPASAILEGALNIVRGEARSLRVTIEALPGSDAYVLGSEIELRQALLNLIRNGIAAAAASSSLVRTGWTVDGGQISFFVENDIYQHKQSQAGMGIGLIIARAIARAHAGTISFQHLTAEKVVTKLKLPVIEQ